MKHFLKVAYNARLDQGLNDAYSCPTCRKPLFVSRSENEANPSSEVLSDEQLARQLSVGLDGQNSSGNVLPPGLFPTQTQNPMDEGTWRLHYCQIYAISF